MPLKKNKNNIVQDVVPPKKSIRNVELPSRAKEKKSEVFELVGAKPKADKFSRSVNIKKSYNLPEKPVIEKKEVEPSPSFNAQMEILRGESKNIVEEKKVPTYAYEYEKTEKPSRKGLYLAMCIFVLAGAFGVSALFKSATVKVTPKHQDTDFSQDLQAKKDAIGAELGYQVVTVADDAQKTVPATGQKKVESKASGKIVIFNKSQTAQKLIATTRFETPEGLVFRLDSAVTVPAQKSSTVAGSVEVSVTADVAGDSYNIGLKDFTLPGLKGTPKYSQVFGRSKTSMTGGFSGMQKIVSAEDLGGAEGSLETSLRQDLSKSILSQIPSNFVLYPDSILYSFDPVRQAEGTSSSAVLVKKGSASAVIFDKGALTRVLLSKILATTSPEDMIKITNLDSLDFSYATATPTGSFGQTLSFNLKGHANMVWIFDSEKMKMSILGLSKNVAKDVLSKHPALSEAWIETQPFWNSTIPVDPKKVTLTNTLESGN